MKIEDLKALCEDQEQRLWLPTDIKCVNLRPALVRKFIAFVEAYDAYCKVHEGMPPVAMRLGESAPSQRALRAARAALEES